MANTRSGLAGGLFSRTREAVIGLLFSQEGVELHGREIAKRAQLSAATVSQELQQLSRLGIVKSRPMANVVLYRADSKHPLYPELRSIAVKTWGVRGRLTDIFDGVRDMRCAFIFGSVARGEDRASSDIDVLAIGETKFAPLALLAEEAGRELKRPVTIKLYRPDEWRRKAKGSDNPFFADVLKGAKIFIRGDQAVLDELTESGQPRAARASRTQDRRSRGDPKSSEDRERSPRNRAPRRRA